MSVCFARGQAFNLAFGRRPRARLEKKKQNKFQKVCQRRAGDAYHSVVNLLARNRGVTQALRFLC